MGGHSSVDIRSETETEREPQDGTAQVAGSKAAAPAAAPAAAAAPVAAHVQNGNPNPHEIESADQNSTSNGGTGKRANGGGGGRKADTRISVEEQQQKTSPETTSSSSSSNGAGPSSRKKTAAAAGGGGTAAAGMEDSEGMVGVTSNGAEDHAQEEAAHRITESSGAERTTRGVEQDSSSSQEEDSRFHHERGNDFSTQQGLAPASASASAGAAVELNGMAATRDPDQQPPRSPTAMSPPSAVNGGSNINKSADSHLIDIPPKEQRSKAGEELDHYKVFSVARTTSNFSVESSTGDQCRICQQQAEEPLMDLGCHCRGELAKAHRSCIDHWFGNKGTNKCEVCQHVATNVPAPASQPTPHFWVWRVGGPYNGASLRRVGGGARFHPLWAALLILVAGLLFDILISIFLGASALPVNIIIGVLVVLGLGTAARLVLECWHERVIRRNIQRMEEDNTYEDFPPEPQPTTTPTTTINNNSNPSNNAASNNSDNAVVEPPAEGQPTSNAPPSPSPTLPPPAPPPPVPSSPLVPFTTPAASPSASAASAAAAGHAAESVPTAAPLPNGTGS